MKHLGHLFLIFFLTSCLPAQQSRTLESAGLNPATTSGSSGGTTTSDTDIAWYQNFTTQKRLTFFRDVQSNTYIKGRLLENYLISVNNPSASYCLEIDMGPTVPVTDKRRMLVRAVPTSVNDITTGKKTYYLRVDFGNPTAGETVCAKDKVQFVDDNNTEFVIYSSAGLTFNPASVCSSCVSSISSASMKLFLVESTRIVQVRPRDLDISSLVLTLLPGNTPGNNSGCTNTACSAIGFNCCLENQCVRDAQVRNGVDTTSASFLAAEEDRLSNPMAFTRYPQFYYICGNTQPGTTTTTTTGSTSGGGQAEADARIKQLQADYKCIQHMKTNSAISPYLQSPFTPVVTDQSICNTALSTSAIFFETILKRLYNACESQCESKYTTLNDKIANCRKWDYFVLASDSAGLPISVQCVELPDETVITPPVLSKASVSSRSVPHRFFSTSGAEVDLDVTNPSTTTQEGTEFFYNDPEKIFPSNGTFNMNSILGQMTLNLDKAVPAKTVDVEIDQLYLINTTNGFYASDCADCSKDAWYTQFSPYPAVARGRGLQAVGYSTKRDAEDGNTTFGNYEDTIFGRACWVPPTMLPFSQPLGIGTAASQRAIRLKTQAAMWVNGYRRDWYGFNQGALIGSFDGVSWFAVGKGRVVRSTTNKLFLAINAPFGDLAQNSVHSVNIQTFDSVSNGAQFDFDPSLTLNHPNQNDAGTCQSYHMCEADKDCITRLGWEYVCADVSQLSTYWPTFTALGANEEPLAASSGAKNIAQILAQGSLPGGSTKRCVYRGAGAVCRTDAGSIATTELDKRKLLTCAPNFWCADVDGSNNAIPSSGTAVKVFNKEVARFGVPVEDLPISRNHEIGQDANVLGRPLDYVHTTSTANSMIAITDSQITSNLNANVTAIDSAALNKVGLCRPGKVLPYLDTTNTLRAWSPFDQHQALDQYSRTDYINQIASCPASFQSIHKTSSCPVLDSTGNYLHQTTAFSSTTQATWANKALAQNSCGLETLKEPTFPATLASFPTADSQQSLSPFSLIEGKPLNAQTIIEKSLTRDACLRKAGSVCHTDLDCSPNKMHAAQLEFFPLTYFGNTPNKEYYEEYLVCGQTRQKPFAGDDDFQSYDLTLNRCCREVGMDLSTYSAYEPTGTGNSEDTTETAGLDPFTSGAEFPTDPSRYERFASLEDPSSTLAPLNAYDERDGAGTLGGILFGSSVTLANVRTPRQWLTLNNANTNTCCGGGWMRKFADGTTDWPIGERLKLNADNFRCLNYISPLVGAADPTIWGLTQSQLDSDLGSYCRDVNASTGGCAQLSIQIENNLSASPSCSTRESGPFGAIPTSVSTLPGEVAFSSNIFSFFPPITADGDTSTFIDYSVAGRRNVTVFLPSYVGSGLTSVSMQRRDSSNNASELVCSAAATGVAVSTDAGTCAAGGAGGGCCFEYNATTRVLKVAFNVSGANSFWDSANPSNSGRYGAKIVFTPPGTAGSAGPMAKIACKDYYYLDLLGRIDLAGIPQITYPKILCNNNGDRLVPGLFKIADSDSNRASFNLATNSFIDPSTTDRHTNYQGLDVDPVFDPHEFKCCTPLGKFTRTASTCCSGLGLVDPTLPPSNRPNFKCMLPSGTDLNVYFNRFVSNEGTNTELPSGGLLTSEYNDQTGEPLINATVNNKLAAIGNSLCDSTESVKTRRGGAFGNFSPEPLSGTNGTNTVYGIVDSTTDSANLSSGGETTNVGRKAFDDGYRWNHHTYCK